MGYEIHWLRRASKELDSIYRFYSEFASEQVAKRRIGIIIDSVGYLQKFPLMGKEDELFTHIRPFRYLVVLTYKVYYFIEDGNVYIASIWDCRQGGEAY